MNHGTSFGLLRGRNFRAACAIGFVVFFNRFGGQNTLVPLIAYAMAGLSVSALGLTMSAVTTVNLLTVRWAGGMSDRFGRKPVIVPSMIAGGAGYLAYLLAGGSPVVFVVTTALVGIVNGFNGPTPATYMADVAPPERRGQAVGVYRTFGDLAGLISPVLLGALVDGFGFEAAIVFICVLTCASAIVFQLTADETVGPRSREPALA